MTMQRDVLKQYLRAGPSRRYDIASFSGRLPGGSPPEAYLFANTFLNGCILFKWVDVSELRANPTSRIVSTLIYLPYDPQRPEGGGESFLFSEERFRQYCDYRISARDPTHTSVVDDAQTLKLLDSVPTFSPFLVELAFKRNGLDIPETYLQLMPEVRDKNGALLRPSRNEDIEIVINLDALTQRMGPIAVKNRSGVSVVAGGAVLVKQIL